jgi:hypothetical protein
MTRSALALGSFIVGACCAFMSVSLIHTSTRVHASQGVIASAVSSEPVVPPLQVNLHNGTIRVPVQSLDGFACTNCTLLVGGFTYAGGAFKLENCVFPANIPVQFKGAALNTLILLQTLGKISIVLPAPKNLPGKPQPEVKRAEVTINAAPNLTLVSLEGLQADK